MSTKQIKDKAFKMISRYLLLSFFFQLMIIGKKIVAKGMEKVDQKQIWELDLPWKSAKLQSRS